jgi:hypothetical protein
MYWVFIFCALVGIYRGLTDKSGKVYRKDNKDFFDLLYLK